MWPFRGWRPALRIARRDALRARGRSILVLVMVGLPVLAIVALDTLARTSSVSTIEGLSRQLGSADALVSTVGSSVPVDQTPDMSSMGSTSGPTPGQMPTPTTATIRSVLGPGARVVELMSGRMAVRTDLGVARPQALGLDLRNPMTRGLLDLRSGRLPRGDNEVVVSGRLSGRGFAVGSILTSADGARLRVVGTVESTTTRYLSLVAGSATALGLDPVGQADTVNVSWLVSRPGGVDWPTVRALNSKGLYALSRSVVEHPPPASEVTMQASSGGGLGSAVAVLALIVAMALLEVVLLAGPAFAVGARRQQRALALMAAGGAESSHLRKVVLASGLVLGTVAAVLGALLGVGVAWVARPGVQLFSSSVLGPFQFSLRDMAAIAACGLASALLAALAPALHAARRDVVAVLAGRRGETRPARWSPVVGGLMLAAGGAGAAYGAGKATGGEVLITLAAARGWSARAARRSAAAAGPLRGP
jgi:putative ABC transport system permease protein